MAVAEYTCPTMRCGGCAETIRTALSATPGVENVTVDVAAKAVSVTYDESQASPAGLEAALAKAGFPPAQ